MSSATDLEYEARLAREQSIFADQIEVHELPQIFHYWSNRYLRPWMEEYGFSNPDQFFACYLQKAAERTGSGPARFVSVGCGNCDTEVRVAGLMRQAGMRDFVIECLDINEAMLERGRQLAIEAGVANEILPIRADFNQWQPARHYAAVMANQSLHHVVELESLFDAVKGALLPNGLFLLSDMIGRNGHQCWPEALRGIWGYWHQLPAGHRYNLQLKRQEDWYESWDCSHEGFEGIRAQDILPLLIERFEFELFLPFGAIIDAFVGRAFGHHLDAASDDDRAWVDRIHLRDEEAIQSGEWTPTHLVAALTVGEPPQRLWSRGLSPQTCIRRPERDEGIGLPSLAQLKDFFSRCGGTDEGYLEAHYARLRATSELVGGGGGHARRILDVGGHWLHQAAFHAHADTQITSIDGPGTFGLPEVREAACRMGIRLLLEPELEQGQALQQLADDSIDLILFTEIIEHLTFNPVELWKELYRVLAPGGRIVITTPNYYALEGSAWHIGRFLRWRGAGITIEEILGKRTFGHHWKEYSMAELAGYFRYLSSDFRIRRARWLAAVDHGRLLPRKARLARTVQRWIPWVRPGLFLEIELPEKRSGIVLEPGW